MTLNLTIPQQPHTDFTPRITVVGVGGGGTNAVNNMIQAQLQGVEFVVANTDAQQLMHSLADRRIQLGPHLTQGLGAGAKPEIGRAAAEEAADELARHMDGAHMVFITAGMGGGTGTGAAPVIARMARERGILTVGVVTKPFSFEGARRAKSADQGISELQQYVDTLIVIPNQNLFRLANERTSWKEAFKMADQVLHMGVRGVTDLMVAPGLVNLDFADIRTVMAEMGKAMMGTGEADGDNRAIRAAEAAINNPLLEDTSMAGARGLLINITGGDDMTLYEVDQAANRIREEVAEDANIIFGSALDESLSGRIRVSVVATGIDSAALTEAQRPRLVAMGGGAPMQMAVQQQIPQQQMQPIAVGAPVTGPVSLPGAPVVPMSSASPVALAPAGHVAPAPQQVPQPALAMVQAVAPQPMALAPDAQPPRAPEPHQAYLQGVPQMAPAPLTVHPVSVTTQPQPARSTLFAAPAGQQQQPGPAPAQSGQPRSLFGVVTGALRRGMGTAHPVAAAPEPARAEPKIAAQPQMPAPATANRTAPDEGGLDIPAFLRRQSS